MGESRIYKIYRASYGLYNSDPHTKYLEMPDFFYIYRILPAPDDWAENLPGLGEIGIYDYITISPRISPSTSSTSYCQLLKDIK